MKNKEIINKNIDYLEKLCENQQKSLSLLNENIDNDSDKGSKFSIGPSRNQSSSSPEFAY